jgi:hypothetical protein
VFHAPSHKLLSRAAGLTIATVRPVNPAAEGSTYPDLKFEVTPERVRAFADVFGDGPGVPPTFPTAVEFAILPQIRADLRLELDFTRVVHASQEYGFARPLRVGETLTVRAKLDSVKVRAGNGFLTIAIDLLDNGGDLVARCRSTMIERASS